MIVQVLLYFQYGIKIILINNNKKYKNDKTMK